MAEYIEREELINNRPEARDHKQIGKEEYNKGWNDCRRAFCELIYDMEAADVAQVVHGMWERDEWGSHLRRCSVCKKSPVYKDERGNGVAVYACICINCGAKMDKNT